MITLAEEYTEAARQYLDGYTIPQPFLSSSYSLGAEEGITPYHHHFIACKNYDRIITDIHLQRYYNTTAAASNPHTNNLDQIRIMVVDDDNDINFVVKAVLSDQGFEVDSYTDPFLALQSFGTGFYHLLIIDIVMPKMNGFELYYEIRKLDNKYVF